MQSAAVGRLHYSIQPLVPHNSEGPIASTELPADHEYPPLVSIAKYLGRYLPGRMTQVDL
jgi:hypothetical protein